MFNVNAVWELFKFFNIHYYVFVLIFNNYCIDYVFLLKTKNFNFVEMKKFGNNNLKPFGVGLKKSYTTSSS